MKTKYLFLVLLLCSATSQAQEGFNSFLQSIEQHNKFLLAAQELSRVQALEAKTGIYPENPEISYDYLNGSLENYSEMVISQSLDFPSSYIYRERVAQLTGEQAQAKYRQTRSELLRVAADLYARILVTNRKLFLYEQLEQLIVGLQFDAEKRLEAGEIDILEANRMKTEVARTRAEISILRLEGEDQLRKLANLNGGIPYTISDTSFYPVVLDLTTDSILHQLMARNPYTRYNNYENEIAVRTIQLERSEALPKLTLGYRQDITGVENYRGIHAGISIPLYENSNAVRLAKAQHAYQLEKTGAEASGMENEFRQMIRELSVREDALFELERIMGNMNTPALLSKSYQAGQLNYTEFFTELGHYLNTMLYIEDLRESKGSLQLQFQVLLMDS